MDYLIGVNYWGSKYGIDMWKYWDEESVRNDFRELSKYGMNCIRVFPNWRDFQPVYELYGWKGMSKEWRFADDVKIDNEFGLDMKMIERFHTLCDIAKECNIQLMISIVTGWMSGRLFVPPIVEGENHITSAKSLVWQEKFVRGIVRNFKDRPEIIAWDLGNESNNLGATEDRNAAYLWTMTIRNAILSEDQSRPIASGMHALEVYPGMGAKHAWTMRDQAELTDILTPHPYPSATVGGHIDPMNKLRTSLVATAQVELYSGIGQRPAMMQESGGVCTMVGSEAAAADFARVNILSGWANGSMGFLWWCAHEQLHLQNPPNTWTMIECQLGILHGDYSPKKAALAMKEASEIIRGMPFEKLPKRVTDGVCVIPRGLENCHYIALSTYTLAKQAGLDLTFASIDQELPDAKLYIVPSINGWDPLSLDSLYALMDKVEKGATVYISVDNGMLALNEKYMGIRSQGMEGSPNVEMAVFEGVEMPFTYGIKYLVSSIGAEVLAKDEDGNVLLSRNKFGKGYVYFSNFPVERYTSAISGCFDRYPYYKIYQRIGENVLKDKPAVSINPNIAVTVHPFDENHFIAVAINYSNEELPCEITFPENAKVSVCHGDGEIIPACSAVVFDVIKEKGGHGK